MTTKALFLAAILSLAAGCAMIDGQTRPPTGASVTVEEEEAWRGAAAEEDAAALDALPGIWMEALADARRGGFARRVAEEGALLAPAMALPRAAPPPGAYLCRVLRLGARMPGIRPWSESPQAFCFVGVERDQLSLTVEAGTRRIGGYLWEEKDNRRLVFLGASSPRGTPLVGYGDDRMRDAAGLFERIGPFRYRLTLPWRGDNKLLVVELSPAPEQ
ncbi:MAG: hypothetical protein JWO81_424 [Alphaproteobacteria bacterium]|nr:hypothetical protein [Alphaproteobacteria bacterium]